MHNELSTQKFSFDPSSIWLCYTLELIAQYHINIKHYYFDSEEYHIIASIGDIEFSSTFVKIHETTEQAIEFVVKSAVIEYLTLKNNEDRITH